MRVYGNFFELPDAGLSFFFKHLNLGGVIKRIRREERLEIPIEALREALTNALCHRLMDSPSGSVGISIYDDRVEIENTGHLPNELTVETIKLSHRSYPQNPIIANALYMTAFLESWGTGVDRMLEACKNAGLPEPEYNTGGGFIWITFWRANSNTNSNTNSVTNTITNSVTNSVTNSIIDSNDNIAANSNGTTMSLSDRQKEILAYCIVARSSREILDHIQVTYQSKNIKNNITPLILEGFLERTIPDKPKSSNQKYITKRTRK